MSDIMYKKIEGIIISEYPFEENSKIINIFTKEGIISVIAKGAKRLKSPFFGTTMRFTYGIFNIVYKEKGLSKLVDADTINDYRSIKKDISKTSYTIYMTELIIQVYKHENNKNIYDLYLMSIKKIEEGYDALVIVDIIKLKLLDYLGIRPVIDSCVECGSTKDIVTISSYRGGYLCKNCHKNEKIVNAKTISLIRMLYYVDLEKITKIDISDEVKIEIDNFINDYYDRYSGIYLKSRSLLETIK